MKRQEAGRGNRKDRKHAGDKRKRGSRQGQVGKTGCVLYEAMIRKQGIDV
jgi:hypothetical protein